MHCITVFTSAGAEKSRQLLLLPFQSKEKGFLSKEIANSQWAKHRGMRGRRTQPVSHTRVGKMADLQSLIPEPSATPICTCLTSDMAFPGNLANKGDWRMWLKVMEEWKDGWRPQGLHQSLSALPQYCSDLQKTGPGWEHKTRQHCLIFCFWQVKNYVLLHVLIRYSSCLCTKILLCVHCIPNYFYKSTMLVTGISRGVWSHLFEISLNYF